MGDRLFSDGEAKAPLVSKGEARGERTFGEVGSRALSLVWNGAACGDRDREGEDFEVCRAIHCMKSSVFSITDLLSTLRGAAEAAVCKSAAVVWRDDFKVIGSVDCGAKLDPLRPTPRVLQLQNGTAFGEKGTEGEDLGADEIDD